MCDKISITDTPTQNPRHPVSSCEASVKRILIIRPCAIGDMIVTLPALGAIRRHFHSARIEIMGYTSLLELVKGRFYADTISRFDHADVATLFIKNPQISPSLIKRFDGVDIIISFVSGKEQIFVNNLKAAGAKRVIHYEPFPYTDEGIHIIDHFLRFLDIVGITHFTDVPKIFLTDEDECFGDSFMKDRGADPGKIVVAVHPGSGSRQKCWPVERFTELILWLKDKIKAQILIISGPADNEIVERLRMKVRDDLVLVDQLSLPNLAAVIKRCNLFIGNDSGITHLAMAVGTATIAIFGATDPKVWGPRGEQVKIFYKKSSCSPCSPDTRRNCFSQMCLENISAEDVIGEITRQMGDTICLPTSYPPSNFWGTL